MTPPRVNQQKPADQPAVNTEAIAREVARREDPREALEARRQAILAEQKAEEARVAAEHLRGRAAVAGKNASARAELILPPTDQAKTAPSSDKPTLTPTTTPASPTAPASAPTAANTPSADDDIPIAEPIGPVESPEPLPTAPTATPSPQPAAAPSTAPAAAPAATAVAAPTLKEQVKGFFDQIFTGFKKFFDAISAKVNDFFKPKPAAQPSAQSTPAATPTPAPAPSPSAARETAPGNTREAINQEAQRLGIEPAFALAIVTVESNKKGINEDGTPVIRFEPHIFNGMVPGGHGKWGASKLVGRNIDGVSCEGGQTNEHACFRKAMEINKDAAYKSMSMGQGQIMGFNAGMAGYPSAEAMYKDFSASGGGEVAQIKAMFKLIEKSPAHLNAARRKDFGAFARLYNGATVGTAKHSQYTAALEKAYRNNGGGQPSGNTKPSEAVA